MADPIRLQILSTFYPHLGSHMGFRQVRRHLDPAEVAWRERLVIKDGAFLPAWFRLLRRLTRRRFSEPPRMYMLEDWLAERRLRRECRGGAADAVLYLDGEHSLHNLPRWLAGEARRPVLAALFHQPPEISDRQLVREVVRSLDAVLVITREQEDWFKTWVDPDRVHLIRHGIDTDFFHPPPEGPPPGPPWRVVTVGRNFRDYPLLFAAAALLHDIPGLEFHVVARLPAGPPLPSTVRVHKGIRDEELAALYRRSHVCALPLTKVTASNTLMEAMATGLPVVTTDLFAVRTYAGEDCARFHAPGDARSLAGALRGLLEDADLRQRLGQAGRARAEACTWRHSAAELTRALRAARARPLNP